MQVALDRADAHLARGFHTRVGHQRLQQLGAHVHGAGRHQHLGHEHFVVLELLANDTHAVEQPLIQDLLHRDAFVDGLLNQFFHDLGFTPLEVFRNVCQNAHTAFPFLIILG